MDEISDKVTEADITETSAESDVYEAWKELTGQEVKEESTKSETHSGLLPPESKDPESRAEGNMLEEVTEPVASATTRTETPTEQIEPPSTWTAKGKEWFSSLPTEAKKEFAKRSADLERHGRQVWEEAAKIRHKYGDIEEVFEEYREQLALEGKSLGQVVRSYLQAENYLNRDLRGALEWLCRTKGQTLQQVMGTTPLPNGLAYQQPVNPVLTQLQDTVASLQSELRAKQEETRHQAAQSVIAKFHAVRDAKDAQGKYLYPELHDETFVQSLQPIMAGLRQVEPNLDPQELLRRAYSVRTGKITQAQVAQQNTAQQNQQHSEAARRASLSARGTPRAATAPTKKPIPDDAEETVRQTAEELGLI